LTETKLISTINEENLPHLDKTYVPSRLLLGPGPSNAHPEVLKALSLNPIGHLDEAYVELMSEVQKLLRYTWQCNNRITLPMSGTGSAAMEASIANFIEPGEKILIAKKGYFGDRLVDMASRYKADVSVIEKEWGEAFTFEEIKYEIETKKPVIFAIVHAETSTGVLQPLEGIGDLCRKNNCLFLVDAVTSLGALELFIDDWKIDLAYSCSQKGLSCPPGLSPFTMNKRAEDKLSARTSKVPNWYLDLSLLNRYWGSDRVYHHTAPVNMNFAIREGLRFIANEGLENIWRRHNSNAIKLWKGLENLGMELHVSSEFRLPTLTTVKIPPAVDGEAFRNHLLKNFGIEIGNGLGALSGKVWRIGLMGFNSSEENVDRLLNLFDTELKKFSIFDSSSF
jgi:alanine-glyoxylate transaminase/serine-glyoxylate transaminase/serine-pyruvate transaminase